MTRGNNITSSYLIFFIEVLMEKEIILTDKNNTTTDGKQFPKTPRPEVIYDGIFPTKEMIINKLRKILKRL